VKRESGVAVTIHGGQLEPQATQVRMATFINASPADTRPRFVPTKTCGARIMHSLGSRRGSQAWCVKMALPRPEEGTV
jgi:hypothetical protein